MDGALEAVRLHAWIRLRTWELMKGLAGEGLSVGLIADCRLASLIRSVFAFDVQNWKKLLTVWPRLGGKVCDSSRGASSDDPGVELR
jgi:hypothetical protein